MTLNLSRLPKISALNFTDQLMSSLVIQTETVIGEEINRFLQNGPETIEIEIAKEEGIFQYIDYYCGLTDQDVMLNEAFTEYFPSLSRRSAFQTIYGVYEVELQALCQAYQSELGGKKFDNFDGSGVVKVHNFIKKYFPNLEHNPEWKLVDKLRILRNNCVHNNGCVYKKNKEIKEIADLIENNPNLFHHNGPKFLDQHGNEEFYNDGSPRRAGRFMIFEKGSLKFVVDTFKAYVEVLNHEYLSHKNT
ncbi:hypothetical protein [Marinobacterium aestuariivivens]|uniref:Cthe-2314-like HEPN domain-containing protein n=1 Tax=Marinobacterium aestuariivivens TaxID=1698799 RepID=A0ABW2A9H6_9GAMM